jgi:hypothetical protein
MDYRRAALIHYSPGPGGGLFLGMDGSGRLVVRDFSSENEVLALSEEVLPSVDSLELTVEVAGGDAPEFESPGLEEGEGSRAGAEGRPPPAILRARAPGMDDAAVVLELQGVDPQRLAGGIALVSDPSALGADTVWFSRLRVEGEGVTAHPGRVLGPVLGAQHLLSRGILSITAQLFPISPWLEGPARPSADTVVLELRGPAGTWAQVQEAPVVVPGYTATFRLEDWDGASSASYRLSLKSAGWEGGGNSYQGTIRSEPLDQDEFVVAAFTGNHNVASPGVDAGTFAWETNVWFPHEDIVGHVRAHNPDFLFFSGDQVYEGASPTAADYENPYQDYLYKWYLWLWAFRDLTADIPSVAVPDDHDVFHGNVWGAGGRKTPPGLTGAEAQDQGGYRLSPDWVNMVQRTQASHLPLPWDPTPSEAGIENYYTDLVYGGVSFAVLEDRKFKSPPKLLLPEADVWNGWAQNPAFDARTEADPPGASLLGESQEAFLEAWAEDWSQQVWMKVVLSQTIFANVATIPSDAMNGSVIPSLPIPEPGTYVTGDKMAADMDSNGWPPSGRDRAVEAMRKGFAVHLAGDQHLASTIQYGVDGFGNGSYALCVPSVANFWPRRWYPPNPGGGRAPEAPLYTGDFLDGFGNPMTVFAVSNPARWGREPAALHQRAPGYGIARFGRATREVSLEAWPRWADPAAGGTPYPGWPVRFGQVEGMSRAFVGYLPTLLVEGMENPVVEVVDEVGGGVVYTLRIHGTRFTPPVFETGIYTVRVGEPETGNVQVLLGLEPSSDSARVLELRFEPGSPG